MHAFIDSAADVIALKVADKITSADLDAIMDRLDRAMADHDQVHVFVEAYGIDGLELAGLPSHVARAMPLLGRADPGDQSASFAGDENGRVASTTNMTN